MQHNDREGLEWTVRGWNLEPTWAREPQIDAIAEVCRRVLNLSTEQACSVKFYAAGAFNKLYIVETAGGKSLLRVSLPVDPGHKTRGEVTTLRWIRRRTQMPVPKVIAFDDTQDNEIGFEWILMELMQGQSAYQRWRKMSMDQKTWLVEQIAEYQGQVFKQSREVANFDSVGTLTESNKSTPRTLPAPRPGRLVSMEFFWGNNFNYDVPRGPFRSSHDWLSARLSLICQKQAQLLEKEEDEDDREDARSIIRLAQRLVSLLPKVFPSLVNPAEPTVLWHDDLSLQNILVDDDGKVTAIIDWECVSAKPLWVAAGVPKALEGSKREEEPDRDSYGDDSESDNDEGDDDDGLDNEGKDSLYWIHLMEYEQTRLRRVYEEKLTTLWPQRATVASQSCLKSDFHAAVDRCAAGWYLTRVEQWIDAVEGGTFPRLADVLDAKV
ncbi:hypothetical protein DL546_006625 [Coniochaeta pulveracea]|uniref:Aminoglycoside phosphotransferase domain-containing protein n=1 Tax=Coniochaeta pulveracea TaxID=177199 RepID=A0A420YBW4_9PEZI|nr:hypothetical protein DL546_006625 [Coniochaeta pulveracea]